MSPNLSHVFLFLLLKLHCLLVLCVNEEGLYLLRSKLTLDDPDNTLFDWNHRDPTPCNWTRVACSISTGTVTGVDLSSGNLRGPFPIHLCDLPNLTRLSLANNFINSSLPLQISSCSRLQYLDLSQNVLIGSLPITLSDLPDLVHLDLSSNNFSGSIPTSFSSFRQLHYLSLVANLFETPFPSLFSNVSSLVELHLAYNPFIRSEMPQEYGNLSNLENLWLADCNLVGRIPQSLGQLSKLTNLDLSLNHLEGPIPSSISMLKAVVQIELYNNTLSGEFPSGLTNLTSLRRIDVSANELTGVIPDELCELQLESLILYENRLKGNLPESIARSEKLVDLRLFANELTGKIPQNLGLFSPLNMIDLSNNWFYGDIPKTLCAKGALEQLILMGNVLSGAIPVELGQCRSLIRIRLKNNNLSGIVPANFWSLPHVSLLELAGNSFYGDISPLIYQAKNLSMLILSGNNFTGTIPNEIGLLPMLYELSASNNGFTGSIPKSFGDLTQIGRIDLHGNGISGEIPSTIGLCKHLSELNIANNKISGKIPPEIGNLPVLNYLDLSDNFLIGDIPMELQNLKLNKLNLSNNLLSGKLPPLFESPIYKDSFVGNPVLCNSMVKLCSESSSVTGKKVIYIWLLRSIFMITGLVFAIGVLLFYWKYINYKRSEITEDQSKWSLKSFHKLGFHEAEILDCLDEDNVIGTGSSGKVYKVVLSNGETVAVKKLRGRFQKGEEERIGDKGFETEIETLGKIRHKNIVKLWCSCVTKDCKLLVYEYMANGSLGDLLHSSKGCLLNWPTRYKIALDSAEGLSYLHHDCVPPIVHRDIKSNNILLDSEFGAKVADFGVAKLVESIGKGAKSMSAIAGSCGYIAPEYAYTLRVSEKSDTYSFGVVLLELVTGKRPTDSDIGENLVKWVRNASQQKEPDHVLDPKLDWSFKNEMMKVLNIGLLCTSSIPINRPSMRTVVNMLHESSSINRTNSLKQRKLSPYYAEDFSDQESVV